MQMGVYIMELTEKKEFDLLSLGEIMLRLSPPDNERICRIIKLLKDLAQQHRQRKPHNQPPRPPMCHIPRRPRHPCGPFHLFSLPTQEPPPKQARFSAFVMIAPGLFPVNFSGYSWFTPIRCRDLHLKQFCL